MTSRDTSRIVAIEPSSRGFGFAVLDCPARLLDWGTVRVTKRSNADGLRRVAILITRYQPDLIVLQDDRIRGFRHGGRSRALIGRVRTLASRKHLRTRCLQWRTVREAIVPAGSATKQAVAAAIAARFPELASRLPPPRKAWMSADERITLFEAVAFAVAAQAADPHRSPLPSPNH